MKTLHGLYVVLCIIFAIAAFTKGNWMMLALFGLFAFLHVSQFFKPAPGKPYKAKVSEADFNV